MDITKRFNISSHNRVYRQCTILQVELTHKDLPLDFAEVQYIIPSDIRFETGTNFDRSDCDGRVTFTTPGITSSVSITLDEIRSLSEEVTRERPQSSGIGWLPVILFVLAVIWVFYYYYPRS